jgi:hypothetical protein
MICKLFGLTFQVGCFGDMQVLICVDGRPHLELKTWPGFVLLLTSLSMINHFRLNYADCSIE